MTDRARQATASDAEQRLVYGINTVESLLQQQGARIQEILHDPVRPNPRLQAVLELARTRGVKVRALDRKELDRHSQQGNHQGIIAWMSTPAPGGEHELLAHIEPLSHPLVLVLDGVQDPHNLGACLRTADAAGVDAVIIPKDGAVGLTPVACKVASGAAERVPLFQITNLARVLKQLQQLGLWTVGLDGKAEQSLYDLDLQMPLVLILGAEGKGMRRLTREHCDYLARLPLSGQAESLNVSVATGVALYEALRQRR